MELKVQSKADGVVVQGEGIGSATGPWSGTPLDDKRILLGSADSRYGMGGANAGLASCKVDVFRDFLAALHRANWSGVASVDTGFGAKKLFLEKGKIVFAASTLDDDRLGAVIHREGKLSNSEWKAVQNLVTKDKKFGQALLQRGTFNNVQLWECLKLQLKQILRSLFMTERIYCEVESGSGLAPTEVMFHENALALLSESYGYGCAFRAFLGRLRAESTVELAMAKDVAAKTYPVGTFVGDLLQLVASQPNVQELLNGSPLSDNYSVQALLNLVNLGLIRVQPDFEREKRVSSLLATLKARLDSYSYLLGQVRRAFQDAKKDLPVKDLKTFASGLNPAGFVSIFVDEFGALGRDSVAGMFEQSASDAGRAQHFSGRVESLAIFLLQIGGDHLDPAVASRIRQDYRAIAI